MYWLASWYLAYLVEGLVLALVLGLLVLAAPRLVSGEPRSLWALRTSMLATAAAVVLGSLGIVYLVSGYLGASPSLYAVVAFVAALLLAQWLFSPYLINAVYRTEEPGPELEWLRIEVERMSRAIGLSKPPKLLVADMRAPNAFAYGSPLAGNFVAVTKGLLRIMPREEVKAVLAHELGHLKHRDVPAILALSLIPTAMYFLGRMLLYWSAWAGVARGRREGNAALTYVAAGLLLLVAGFVLHFMVTHFNRLREYYADASSGLLTGEPRLLQRALARLHLAYRDESVRAELSSRDAAAMLFIVNYLLDLYGSRFYEPGPRLRWRSVDIDEVVEELKAQRVNPVAELFSTHPPVPKRLRFLDNLRARLAGEG